MSVAAAIQSAANSKVAISALKSTRLQKAVMTLTPAAVNQLHQLVEGPDPKFIRVAVKNKGCAGQAYFLEYTKDKGKFDEVVSQDGVKIFIDSKSLVKMFGSEMDYVEDRLSSKFVFNNPNIKESCGCRESFSI